MEVRLATCGLSLLAKGESSTVSSTEWKVRERVVRGKAASASSTDKTGVSRPVRRQVWRRGKVTRGLKMGGCFSESVRGIEPRLSSCSSSEPDNPSMKRHSCCLKDPSPTSSLKAFGDGRPLQSK